jgi:hypothetical protein
MADQIVTPAELATFLQLGAFASLTADQQATLTMLANLATAKVQAAAGQRIVDATDTAVIDVEVCDFDEYLPLPQLPVRSVATVTLNGTVISDWFVRKQQLWRLLGWSWNTLAPSQVKVLYTHGYLDGAAGLELARGFAFALGAAGWGNPGGATSEAIDDYKVTYAEADARMQVTDSMRDQLQAAYGTAAYVVGSRN